MHICPETIYEAMLESAHGAVQRFDIDPAKIFDVQTQLDAGGNQDGGWEDYKPILESIKYDGRKDVANDCYIRVNVN